MKHMTVKEISLISVMAAAVYAASAYLQIPIPTAIDNTRLHMGNVMCLLSGLLLGPISGGLSAGIGSMFFDLTNPAYITSAPFTFAFKFLMAWICGKLAISLPTGISLKSRYLSGAILGSLSYVLMYMTKSFMEQRFVLGFPMEAVLLSLSQKAAVSLINAIVSVIVTVPLGIALGSAIKKSRD